jgi:hypothetical protein
MGLFLYKNRAFASNLLAAGSRTPMDLENGPMAHFLFVWPAN